MMVSNGTKTLSLEVTEEGIGPSGFKGPGTSRPLLMHPAAAG
jgi:hypothetical protein